MDTGRTISEHLVEPNVSIDQHTNQRIKMLGKNLNLKRAVYLDTRFWLILRDSLENNNNTPSRILTALLREKTKDGLIYCPISEHTFVELMKQSDLISRKATANLIEELSLGVALIPEDHRIATEISYFIYKNSGEANLLSLDELVWCKLSYVLGILHPKETAFDLTTELAIQKAFFDHMWDIPFTKMIEQIGNTPVPGINFNKLANKLNTEIADHAHEIRSFRQAYKAEIRGVVDIVGHIVADTMPQIALSRGIQLKNPTPTERKQVENSWKNLMVLALEKGKAQRELRSIHILACLHAALRWNKGEKFNSNDLFDFHHGTAALAYCDAFFTDGPFCSMIKRKDIQLDKQFECYVTAEIGEAIEWVKAIK